MVRIHSVLLLLLLNLLVSDKAAPEQSHRDSIIQFMEQIELLKNDTSASPMDRIKELLPIIQKSKKENWEKPYLQASLLNIELLIEMEDIKKAAIPLEDLFKLAQASKNEETLIRLELAELAIADIKGSFTGIAKQHQRLLVKAEQLENLAVAGDIYLAVGRSQYRMAEYSNAIITLESAFNAFEKTQDNLSLADVFGTLGNINTELGNSETARKYLNKALDVARQTNNKFAISIILYNISNSYSYSGDNEQAKIYMRKALNLSVELGDDIGVAWAKKELADIHLEDKQWQDAIDLYSEIEPTLRESRNAFTQLQVFTSQALAYLALDKIDAAFEKAKQGEPLLEHMKKPSHRIRFNNVIADIKYAKGEYQSAFDILKENFEFANDSYNKDKQTEIEKYRIKFDIKIKEKENESLAFENELNKVKILQQTAQQEIWWVIVGFSVLLLLVLGLMLFLLTRNRNYFKAIALKDPLTDCPNRRAILNYADSRFFESKRTGQPLLIGLIDLDHFKGINDKYGHKVGDEVLKAFAKACKMSIRQYDQFGRYGGEEWLIVFSSIDKQNTKEIFVRIRSALNEIIRKTNSDFKPVTFSMGVALFDATLDESSQALIQRADKKLYQAKAQGRNQVVY